MHGSQINPGQPEAVRPNIPVWGVLTVRVGLATRWRSGIRGYGLLWRRLEAGREDREDPFTVSIARAQLGGRAIAEGEGVDQDKERLLAPCAGQRQGNLRRIFLPAADSGAADRCRHRPQGTPG